MRVKRKFHLLFIGIVSIILVLVGYTVYSINFFNSANVNIQNINDIQNDIFLLHILHKEQLKSNSKRSIKQCEILEKKINDNIQSIYFLKYQEKYVNQLKDDIAVITEILNQLSKHELKTEKQIAFLESRANVKLYSCSSNLQNLRKQTRNKISKKLNAILLAYFVVISLLIAVIYMIYRLIGNSMISPLYSLIDQIKIVGGGNLKYQIKYEKRDEFNDLVVAFNNMTLALNQMYTSVDYLNQEIEKRKISELKLLESNTNLKSFASVLTHDIKSPLYSLMGLMDLFSLETKVLGDRNMKYFSTVKEKAQTICKIVDDVLVFSSIDCCKNEKTIVNLNDSLHNAIDNLNEAISKSSAKIISSNLPTFLGHDMQFVRLFQNLISNAIKYCDKEVPLITIGYEKTNDSILLTIRDNGIGIEKEMYDKVFLMFTQINTAHQGFGIGLASVKKIVENHNGKIWLESELGIGSCFYVKIPIS